MDATYTDKRAKNIYDQLLVLFHSGKLDDDIKGVHTDHNKIITFDYEDGAKIELWYSIIPAGNKWLSTKPTQGQKVLQQLGAVKDMSVSVTLLAATQIRQASEPKTQYY